MKEPLLILKNPKNRKKRKNKIRKICKISEKCNITLVNKKSGKYFKGFNPDLPKDFANPGESGLIKTLSTMNLKNP